MENKENVLKNLLTEEALDAVNEIVGLDEVADSDVDEAAQALENDSDVQKLKEQQAELMQLWADPNVMKAYRAIRKDVYGVGERRQVSQKEKKKKKAKRRMAKKSRR